jgi:predicted component of type VI protein secretion system
MSPEMQILNRIYSHLAMLKRENGEFYKSVTNFGVSDFTDTTTVERKLDEISKQTKHIENQIGQLRARELINGDK